MTQITTSRRKAPESAVFQITYACNYQCTFCLNDVRADPTQTTPQASFEDQCRIISKLASAGVTELVISGGEPLTHLRCSELIAHAKNCEMHVSLQTNGSFINEGFLQKQKGKLSFIQVSLEGTKEEHECVTRTRSFERIIENMRKIVASEIPLSTNFTITRQNYQCLDLYVPLIESLEVSFANFTRLYHSGNASKNQSTLELSKDEMAAFLKNLERQQKKSRIPLVLSGPTPLCFLAAHGVRLEQVNTCGAGKDEINIRPNGDVTMCPSDSKVVGNLLKESLNEIWNKPALVEIGERKRAHPECKTCELFSVCGGGCLVSQGTGACKGCDVYMMRKEIREIRLVVPPLSAGAL